MPAPLNSPSWELPVSPHLPPWPLPIAIISWSLRVLAVIPAKRWWGVPSLTPSPHFLIHTLAPELWERWTAAGHWCPALSNIRPPTLERDEYRPVPQALEALGTD